MQNPIEGPIVTVVYSHGRKGSPWYGFKIEALRVVALKMGINVISIRYPEDMPVTNMEQKLLNTIKDDVNVPGDLIFLASSRGAYLSTRVSQQIVGFYSSEDTRIDDDKVLPKRHLLGQFLIAPAFYIKPDYYPDQNPTPANIRTTIVHGFDDSVIGCENSLKFSRLFKTQLHLIEGGHRMNTQRDRLCMLFESFLSDCIIDSQKMFGEWINANPQPNSLSD